MDCIPKIEIEMEERKRERARKEKKKFFSIDWLGFRTILRCVCDAYVAD